MCIVASARNPLKGIQNAVISAMFIVRCTLIPASEDPKNPCIGSTSPMVIQLHNRPLTSSVLAKNACSKAIDPKVISETFRWETQIFEFLGFSLSCRQTASFPSSLLESVRHQSFLPVPLHVCFFYHFLSSSGISFLTSLREWQRKTPCVSLCRTLLRLLSFAQPMSHNLFCVRPPSLRSFPATSTCFVIRPWVVFLFGSALSGSTQSPSFSSSHASGWSPTSFQQLLLPGFLTFVLFTSCGHTTFISPITPSAKRRACQLEQPTPRSLVSRTTRTCWSTYQLPAGGFPLPAFCNTSRGLHPIVPSIQLLPRRALPCKPDLLQYSDRTSLRATTRTLQGDLPAASAIFLRKLNLSVGGMPSALPLLTPCGKHPHSRQLVDPFPHVRYLKNLCFLDTVN